MEYTNQVKTFKTSYMCEDCLEEKGAAGEYKPTGVSLMTNPPQYEHKCTDCGRIKNFNKIYPFISYETISNWE